MSDNLPGFRVVTPHIQILLCMCTSSLALQTYCNSTLISVVELLSQVKVGKYNDVNIYMLTELVNTRVISVDFMQFASHESYVQV